MKKIYFVFIIFITIRANGQTPNWTPYLCNDEFCSLISNSSFTIFQSSSVINILGQNGEHLIKENTVDCWFPMCGSPIIPIDPSVYYSALCNPPAGPGCFLNEIFLTSDHFTNLSSAGQLQNFIPGHTYLLMYKIKTTGVIDNFYVNIGNVLSPPMYGQFPAAQTGPFIETFPHQNAHTLSSFNSSSYISVCSYFTANSPYDAIYFYPQQNSGSPHRGIYISDFQLYDFTLALTGGVQDYVMNCNNQTLTLGNPDCNIPGSWSWTPANLLTNANTSTPTVNTIVNTTGQPQNYTFTGTLTVGTPPNACSVSDNVTVTVMPTNGVATIIPQTVTYYCAVPETLSFSTNFPPGLVSGYSWWISSGNGTIISQQNNPTVDVQLNGGTVVLEVEILDNDGCSYFGTIQITQTIPAPKITGPLTVCPGQTYTYSLTGFNPAYNYSWTVNGAASYTINSSNGTIDIVWGNNPGTYTLGVTVSSPSNPNCTGSSYIFVTILPAPATPVITGPLQSCNYGSGAPYSISNYNSALTYIWNVTGGTFTGGGQNITVNWTGTGGQVSVTAVGTNGCTSEGMLNIAPCCEPPGAWAVTYAGTNDNAVDFINNLNGGNPIIFNHTIGINDVFYINTFIDFQNCDIYFGPNAKVIIEPGITGFFTRSTLQACTDMWDGIYVTDLTPGTFLDVQSCQIYHAENAIYSANGGKFRVNNCTFNNNYVGIWIKDYVGTHQAIIDASTFTYNPFLGGLRPPHAPGTRGLCGVKIDNMQHVQVGTSDDPTHVCNFSEMDYGVFATGSYYSVVNCNFFNFNSGSTPNLFLGCGIYSVGYHPQTILPQFPNLSPSTTYIGNTIFNTAGPFRSNTFHNCEKGVFLVGHANTYVQGNTLTDNTQVGVLSLWGRKNKNIIINDNTIVNNTPNIDFTGISVLESSVNYSARYEVNGNVINNISQGINNRNTLKPRILRNSMIVQNPVTMPWAMGIYSQNSNAPRIENNLIWGANPGATTIGILSDMTPTSTEKCNYTVYTFMGLMNGGPCPSSSYTCNSMWGNPAGYFNLNGYIGNQYRGGNGNPKSAENQWIGCGYNAATYFTTTTTPVIDEWWVRGGNPLYRFNVPTPNYVGDNNHNLNNNYYWEILPIDDNTTTGDNCHCQFGIPAPEPPKYTEEEIEELRKEFIAVMSNTLGIKPDYAVWLEKDALYKDLVNDTVVITDSELLDFKNTVAQQNIGKLQKGGNVGQKHLEVLLDANTPAPLLDSLKNDALLKQQEQESILPDNQLEYYGKLMNVIRLRLMIRAYDKKFQQMTEYVASNPGVNPFKILYPVTPGELDTLIEIARLCPYTTGNSVYEARALVKVLTGEDYFNECEFFDQGMVIRNEDATAPDMQMNLYPNPASNKVVLELLYSPDDNASGMVTITDALGRVVGRIQMQGTYFELDVTNLSAGTYIIQYKGDSGFTTITKLMVTH